VTFFQKVVYPFLQRDPQIQFHLSKNQDIYINQFTHNLEKVQTNISVCQENKSKSAKFSNGHRMIAICNSYRFKYVLLFGITCCRLLTVLLS
jgi:recombinational DNA repair protein RecR